MPPGGTVNYVLTSDADGVGTWQDPGTASLPLPDCCGQILFATTSAAFTSELPLTADSGGWLTNNNGFLLVVG
jgi:hypothetical protein